MRVLVTGCAGFIGSHLSEALVAQGHDVVGVDAFTPYYPRQVKEANMAHLRSGPRFSFLELDLSTGDVTPALEGVQVVYHQAAQPGVRASWGSDFGPYAANNILATQRLLEAARKHPPRKLVFASSSSVYGDAETFPTGETALPAPISPYGVTKLAAEQLVQLYWRNHGVPTLSLRYFGVYGPRQRPDMAFHRFISAALSGAPIEVYGDGEQTRDFTYVSDAVDALICAADSNKVGLCLNVGSDNPVSVNYLAKLLRASQTVHIPKRPGEPDCTFADTSRIKAELGWTSKVPIEDGVQNMLKVIDYWRDAPVWTPDSIAVATKDWFTYLGRQ